MPIRAREFDRMVDKFGFETRHGRALRCTMTRDQYIEILKRKGVIREER